ncbi:hypothetical protein LCGC14_0220270 [marine sediment metagenome]|uniref:Uncharacterized protein n=1 Tax=marine sediment metagenome TaxID=412755 RepID=A0A0F9WXL0_9ZZZZ
MFSGCELNECGHTPDGLRVRAITDAMGAQVVVTNDLEPDKDSLLTKPLENHKTAIVLGESVARNGISVYEGWRGPIGTVFEFVEVMAHDYLRKRNGHTK